jgi:molybdopterin-guanine dinucleotide biosynthesis protein A
MATVIDVIEDLVAGGRLARSGETVHDPARGSAPPPELVAAMDRLEAALSVAAPPPLEEAAAAAGCPPEGVRALVAEGRIVRLGPDLAWSAGTYQGLAGLALEHARATPLTPAAYRDATRTSRKYVMAILEDLDRRGILARTPAGHVPGPRASRATIASRMTRLPDVTGIVLAGGRSTRFGGPKLQVELDGRPLLDHAIGAVAEVAARIIVAGAAVPDAFIGGGDTRVEGVPDQEAFAGPLAGLAGALEHVSTRFAFVVGGDMPGLVPAVLRLMLERLAANDAFDAALLAGVSASSHRQVLPLAIDVARASAAAREVLVAGDRSLVRLLERLRVDEVPAAEWLALDPPGRTLLDVDRPADVDRIRHKLRRTPFSEAR